MKEIITVRTENKTNYDVVFGDYDSIDPKTYFPAAEKCLIVTDANVDKFYKDKIGQSLNSFGENLFKCVLDPGERNKNLSAVEKIINVLGENDFSRGDAVIAVGGGVVSDLAGFAAGIFKRGINYVTIPTTLLAMVDASVGGKTGFDTAFGKNSVGIFHQPSGVLIDPVFLNTLPDNIFCDGMAEAVKCGVIAGGKLWENVKNHGQIDEIIKDCVRLKAEIVAEDEHDTGKRHLLNLGHSLGHAIEKASDYSVSHGYAVAMGLSCVFPEANETLESYALPTSITLKKNTILLEKAFENIKFDKKRTADGLIDVVLAKKPGDVEILSISLEEFRRLVVGNV